MASSRPPNYAHVIETMCAVLDRAFPASRRPTGNPGLVDAERVIVAGCPVSDEAGQVGSRS